MRFLTAQDAVLLTSLGRHYHSAAVAESLKKVLDDVRTVALAGGREATVRDFAQHLDVADLVNSLRTLGFRAKAVSNTETVHVIEISW